MQLKSEDGEPWNGSSYSLLLPEQLPSLFFEGKSPNNDSYHPTCLQTSSSPIYLRHSVKSISVTEKRDNFNRSRKFPTWLEYKENFYFTSVVASQTILLKQKERWEFVIFDKGKFNWSPVQLHGFADLIFW